MPLKAGMLKVMVHFTMACLNKNSELVYLLVPYLNNKSELCFMLLHVLQLAWMIPHVLYVDPRIIYAEIGNTLIFHKFMCDLSSHLRSTHNKES